MFLRVFFSAFYIFFGALYKILFKNTLFFWEEKNPWCGWQRWLRSWFFLFNYQIFRCILEPVFFWWFYSFKKKCCISKSFYQICTNEVPKCGRKSCRLKYACVLSKLFSKIYLFLFLWNINFKQKYIYNFSGNPKVNWKNWKRTIVSNCISKVFTKNKNK